MALRLLGIVQQAPSYRNARLFNNELCYVSVGWHNELLWDVKAHGRLVGYSRRQEHGTLYIGMFSLGACGNGRNLLALRSNAHGLL